MSESFDRALRSAARRGRPAGVCPDAASLAAYADNGLTADERRRVEAHAADCATCLEHLALLGAISLDRQAPEPSRSWLVRWGWLVPVATAVLLIAVWVRLPEQKASEDASAALGAKQVAPRAMPDQERAAAAAPSAERDTARRNQAQRVAAKTAQAPPAREVPPAETKVDELAALERQDSARTRVPTAPTPVAAPPPAAPAAQAEDAVREKAQGLRVGAATTKVAEPAAVAAPALADAMKKEARTELASPRESYRALGSRIEQSKDGGRTWSTALSDPQSTFTSVGCAPAGGCWIGTADGQMLRPTPGGFSRSVLPVRARVVAIAAGDSQTAIVTIEGGRRFRTTDGGSTWAPIP